MTPVEMRKLYLHLPTELCARAFACDMFKGIGHALESVVVVLAIGIVDEVGHIGYGTAVALTNAIVKSCHSLCRAPQLSVTY